MVESFAAPAKGCRVANREGNPDLGSEEEELDQVAGDIAADNADVAVAAEAKDNAGNDGRVPEKGYARSEAKAVLTQQKRPKNRGDPGRNEDDKKPAGESPGNMGLFQGQSWRKSANDPGRESCSYERDGCHSQKDRADRVAESVPELVPGLLRIKGSKERNQRELARGINESDDDIGDRERHIERIGMSGESQAGRDRRFHQDARKAAKEGEGSHH